MSISAWEKGFLNNGNNDWKWEIITGKICGQYDLI